MRRELGGKEERKERRKRETESKKQDGIYPACSPLSPNSAASFSVSFSLLQYVLSLVIVQSVHFPLGERNWRRDSRLANQRIGCETRAKEAERDRNLVGLLQSFLLVFCAERIVILYFGVCTLLCSIISYISVFELNSDCTLGTRG